METSDLICNVITVKIEKTDLVNLNFQFFLYSFSSFIICAVLQHFFSLSLAFIGFGEHYVFFLIKKFIMREIFSYESL